MSIYVACFCRYFETLYLDKPMCCEEHLTTLISQLVGEWVPTHEIF